MMLTLTRARAGDCDCGLCSQGMSALHLALHYGNGDHSLDIIDDDSGDDNKLAKSVQILLKYHANLHAANDQVSLQPHTVTSWMFPVPYMLSALLSRAAMYAVAHVSRHRALLVATDCHRPRLKPPFKQLPGSVCVHMFTLLSLGLLGWVHT